jgi:hypothetical protein
VELRFTVRVGQHGDFDVRRRLPEDHDCERVVWQMVAPELDHLNRVNRLVLVVDDVISFDATTDRPPR